MAGRELTQRADQSAATQRYLHDNTVALKANIADMHPIEAQQT